MPNLSELAHDILNHPAIHDLDLEVITTFVRLLHHLKYEIILQIPSLIGRPQAPYRLPQYIHILVARFLELDDATMLELWDCLKEHVWATRPGNSKALTPVELQRLERISTSTKRIQEKIGAVMLYPPVICCLFCGTSTPLRNSTLSRVEVTVYSASDGLAGDKGYASSYQCTSMISLFSQVRFRTASTEITALVTGRATRPFCSVMTEISALVSEVAQHIPILILGCFVLPRGSLLVSARCCADHALFLRHPSSSISSWT
ncbi:hypothetical protein BDN72DRAFT_866395, partial [Pluteus cervinus]